MLQHDKDNNVMFCEWCHRFDKNEHKNQFVKGRTSMKLESIKKQKQSRQHRDLRQLNRPVLGKSVLQWIGTRHTDYGESETDSSDSEDDIDS